MYADASRIATWINNCVPKEPSMYLLIQANLRRWFTANIIKLEHGWVISFKPKCIESYCIITAQGIRYLNLECRWSMNVLLICLTFLFQGWSRDHRCCLDHTKLCMCMGRHVMSTRDATALSHMHSQNMLIATYTGNIILGPISRTNFPS